MIFSRGDNPKIEEMNMQSMTINNAIKMSFVFPMS
jgi:hypothetical protein